MMLFMSAEIGRPDPGAQAPTREEKGDPDLRPYSGFFYVTVSTLKTEQDYHLLLHYSYLKYTDFIKVV